MVFTAKSTTSNRLKGMGMDVVQCGGLGVARFESRRSGRPLPKSGFPQLRTIADTIDLWNANTMTARVR